MARESELERHYLAESEEIRNSSNAEELLKYVEYKIFKEQSYSFAEKLISKGSEISSKILKLKLDKKSKERIDNLLYLTGYRISAEQLYSFASLVLILSLLVGIILVIFLFSFFELGVSLIIVGILGYYLIINWPHHQFIGMLSKSSGSLVTSVIYMIIYMRLHSNLEGALSFAADNLTGYLAVDFRKMLWDIETRKYKNASEALANYVSLWVGINQAFVDSMLLIESAASQKDAESTQLLLDQASNRIIEGTYNQMSQYAISLREPLNTIYMIGMILPILGMVLMPLVISFIRIPFFSVVVAIMYDVMLPIIVYMLLYDKLRLRPAGFPAPDVSKVPDLPPPLKFRIKIGKKSYFIRSYIPGIIIGAIFAYLSYLLLPFIISNSYVAIIASLVIIIGIGIPFALTFYLGSYEQENFVNRLYSIQDSFSSVAFQISSFLSQGLPPESAVLLAQKNTEGSPIQDLMIAISNNIKRLGLSLRDALFDPYTGALSRFPSPQIVAAMKIFLETTERSSTFASIAMLSISKYFSNLSRVDSQVKSLLEEVTSGMKFEVAGLSPVMAGIVVGLTTLIAQVLSKLGVSLSSLQSLSSNAAVGGYAGAALAIFSIFNLSGGAILPGVFQIIVGLYIIELSLIIGYSVSTINRPGDVVGIMNQMAKILFMSLFIYVIVAAGVSYFFGSLGASVLSIGT
ncbi:MAG: hypothetical protein OH318_02565 [Candidatus Parvarchaeota archaeon]|nr:hypothetical protein [Candidatus Rehaiarchaeum fermentans]